MTDAAFTAGGRDGQGRFQPGRSGNPAGKKPGTRNWSTRFQLLLDEGDFEAAGRLIVQKMHEGSLSAARLIIDHVDPKPRGRPIALDVAPEASLVERYAALTRAMLAGEVSPQEATAMARLLEREATLRSADAAAPAPQKDMASESAPMPAPTLDRQSLDLHSACIAGSLRADPPRFTGLPDWRGSVSYAALTAAWPPASGLHPSLAPAASAAVARWRNEDANHRLAA